MRPFSDETIHQTTQCNAIKAYPTSNIVVTGRCVEPAADLKRLPCLKVGDAYYSCVSAGY